MTRCTSLANLVGSYLKPKDSTSVYIKAIEIKTEFNDELEGFSVNPILDTMLENDENPFVAAMMVKNQITQ